MAERKRKFPIQSEAPSDDETLVYKIFGDATFDSNYLIIGDTVFLSDEGIQILAPTDGSYYDQNAYTFKSEDNQDIGGLYGRDDSGQNIIAIRSIDPAGLGDDVLVELEAHADPTAVSTVTAQVNVQATREGESTDTYMSLVKDDNSSEVNLITNASYGRVRIKPSLQMVGASNENCYLYMKGTNLIIKYNDGGTTRYKYLNLSGTGTTWTHSTTEPS